jgi:putative transcriptional regulator
MSDPFRSPPPFRSLDGDGASDEMFGGLAGRLLIAMPNIGDPTFERSVILMCVHSQEQAMGVMLNRPAGGLSLRDVCRRLGLKAADAAPDQPVLVGGPVEQDRGFVLHTDDFETLDATLPIVSGVSLTATREVLEAMTDEDRRPQRARLALGCAQWAPGQLERELAANIWLDADADAAIIFDDNHDTKWMRALHKLGVTPDRLSGQAGHA